jgi:hypothetical protein
MIQEDTVRIYWKKLPEKVPFYEDGKDLAHALRLRKDFILSDIEGTKEVGYHFSV